MRSVTLIVAVGGLLSVGSRIHAKGVLNLPWLEIRPGITVPGESVNVTVWVENTSGQAVENAVLKMTLPEGVEMDSSTDSLEQRTTLRPKEAKRFLWSVKAARPGTYSFQAEAKAPGADVKRRQTLCVVAKRDPRHEFQAVTGAWARYPDRPTLQEGNGNPIGDYESLPSGALKHNLFGITAHLPRDTNDEDPFIASRAVDGDPDTCWGSQWWRTNIPFQPEWIEVDLGRIVPANEIRFLPGWENSGVPQGFTIQVSTDGKKWNSVADETDFQLRHVPDSDQMRQGRLTWQRFPFDERPVRHVRLEATRLGLGPTWFYCSPGNHYQLRIAELKVLDKAGKNFVKPDDAVRVSTTHTAWFNTPETIKKTWPLLFQSGVKLNRIGQWGDKTDWATVEKTKGNYIIEPDIDRGVSDCVKNGVDVLLTLDYGNDLYQRQNGPPNVVKTTWVRSHPFLLCAPTTPEAVKGFANYCAFMAKHFKGRIKYFEIWNEENGWFFDASSPSNSVGLVRAYGRALAVAAKAIKEVNPEAIVLFGGVAGSTLDYPRIAMKEGAGPYIDVFAFHPYYHPLPEEVPANILTQEGEAMVMKPLPPAIKNYEQLIEAYKEIFRPYNPKIQVWADEWNYFAPGEPASSNSDTFMFPDQSELSQAKFLARFFTESAWLETGAIWWSLYNSNHVQEWAVIRSADCTPRGSFYSAGYVSTALDDCRGASDVKAEVVGAAPGDLVVRTYRNGKGELLIGLWRKSVPDDGCRPTPVMLKLPNISGAVIVDTLYGYQQQATIKPTVGGVELPGLLVGDWPLILRISQ
jgi:hypothetical protein